jgi:hypothetical protein
VLPWDTRSRRIGDILEPRKLVRFGGSRPVNPETVAVDGAAQSRHRRGSGSEKGWSESSWPQRRHQNTT